MNGKPTIQMVAERAGVSRGTVDRVLNDRPHVNAEVRSRVLAAVRELDYVPLRAARAAGGAPERLGVLLPNWEGQQFFSEASLGIEQASRELEDVGFRVLVRRCRTELPQEAAALLEELAGQGVRGIALCALNDPAVEEKIAELSRRGIPCVTFNSDLPQSRRLCFVGQDIRKSGRVAAELMGKCVPRGGVVLATIGSRKFDGHRQRLDGFCQRMRELGFREDQLLIGETYNDYAASLALVAETIARQPMLRGVYMANLNVAGCAEAIRSAGKQGQIHVICHDVNESVRQLMAENIVDFTIPQDFVQQGYLPLILLRDLLRKGLQPDPARFPSQIGIVCRENLPD